jgi:proteasome lid subunit RPN8/RPN11
MYHNLYALPDIKKEVAVIIADNKVISLSEGTLTRVEFDFFEAWQYWKKHKPKVLYMFHVHPEGSYALSGTDRNMLKGWAKAFPIPIIYGIVTKHMYGVRTNLLGQLVIASKWGIEDFGHIRTEPLILTKSGKDHRVDSDDIEAVIEERGHFFSQLVFWACESKDAEFALHYIKKHKISPNFKNKLMGSNFDYNNY